MNVQHSCVCRAPQTLPGTQPAPQPKQQTPAPVPAGTATAVVTQSYHAEYFSYAYVAAAQQSAAQHQNPDQVGNGQETRAHALSQPMQVSAAFVRLRMEVIFNFAAWARQGQGPTEEGTLPAAEQTAAKAAQTAANAAQTAEKAAQAPGPQPAIAVVARPPARFQDPGPATADPVKTAAPGARATQPAKAASGVAARPAIETVNAEGLQRFRMQHRATSTETALQLELTTREGDRIVLDFSQIDALVRNRARGVTEDGNRLRLVESATSTERAVHLSITGELSDEEKAAIEALLAHITEVANEFFGGSMEAALDKARDMTFDTQTLLDVSLQMSLSHNTSFTRAFSKGGDAMEALLHRDTGVRQTLEYLGDAQRELVEQAKTVLDDKSAARVVRTLLPSMLDSPLRKLAQLVDGHGVEAPETTPGDAVTQPAA